MGKNPAMSDPEAEHARAGLAKLEHLVVQGIFLTGTAFHADVVLPASAWPEKDGTVTNTNRQAQMGRAVLAGMVFVPFCYAEAAANALTNPALDPLGKIPEFKYCAARVEAITSSRH